MCRLDAHIEIENSLSLRNPCSWFLWPEAAAKTCGFFRDTSRLKATVSPGIQQYFTVYKIESVLHICSWVLEFLYFEVPGILKICVKGFLTERIVYFLNTVHCYNTLEEY